MAPLTRSLGALRLVAALAFLAFVASFAAAANYPALTGRVVDDAHLIDPVTKADLERQLADLEQKSGIQLVAATVPSLDGQEIEPYANALFRAWKLGDAKKNNGVLLLLAPNEHRVRIEVGYGLEGTLTDAVSKLIIINAIAPRAKAGDFSGGIKRGVEDVVTVLTTDSTDWQKKPDLRAEPSASLMDTLAPFLIFLLVLFILSRFSRGRGGVVFIPTGFGGGAWGGGGGFSSGGGGGFSGGGGSSGGGGASGSW
jgi:uncharacterized protein